MNDPEWLQLARELQAIAQSGLTFSTNPFDLERFTRVRQIAAALYALGAGAALEPVLNLFEQEHGYATPKVDVRGAVFNEAGRVLLVREVSDGRWTLPGGWADVNQTARECVEREIREESGFEARAIKLAGVWDYHRQGHRPSHPFSIYKMFFVCERTGGQARSSIETSAVDYFALDALPELSSGRASATQIRRMHQHWREPYLPADFD